MNFATKTAILFHVRNIEARNPLGHPVLINVYYQLNSRKKSKFPYYFKQRGQQFFSKIKQRLSNDLENFNFVKGLLIYCVAYKTE